MKLAEREDKDAEARATAWGRDKHHGEHKPKAHVVLTTHPRRGLPVPITWAAKDPKERGPVIATDPPPFPLLTGQGSAPPPY